MVADVCSLFSGCKSGFCAGLYRLAGAGKKSSFLGVYKQVEFRGAQLIPGNAV